MAELDRAAIERILKDDYDPKGDYAVGSESDRTRLVKEGYHQVGVLKYLPLTDPNSLIFQKGGKQSTSEKAKPESHPPKPRPKVRAKPKPRPRAKPHPKPRKRS